MKILIVSEPKFQLELDKLTVDTLSKLADSHYDRQCKSAAQHGDFLYGWANCVRMGINCNATFRQLDLTLKIAELSNMFPLKVKEAKAIKEYVALAFRAIRMSDEIALAQKPIEVK